MNQGIFQQLHRIKRIPWYVACLFAIICARLFHLQIISSLTFFQMSKKNYSRLEKIIPPRGNIIDCTGKLIATNQPLIQLAWIGTGNRKLTSEQHDILLLIDTLFEQDFVHNEQLIAAERQNKTFVLFDNVSFEKLSALLEQIPCHKNISVRTTFKRFYPYAESACHILGYLSGVSYESPSGKMGLEKIFDESLRGIPGQILTTINSIGKHLSKQEIQHALSGATIETTLNIILQRSAEHCFPAGYTGSILLMDATTGALRVVLSQPTFNPHIFLQPLTTEQWNSLQQNKPFMNRAFAGLYPPASLFKLVTLIAALEQNIITSETTWFCKGSIEFCNRSYRCKNRIGHGPLTTQEALVQSCNIPFYEIGKKIKIDTLAHYAHMLGLGIPTTEILPEKSGLIPTSTWKRKTFGKPWWPGETLSTTIGQSFLLVTPIQICRMICAICEGHLITPRILEMEPIQSTPIPVQKKTLAFIKNGMKQVILRGTGQRLSNLQDIVIYGKTGTAQVRSLPQHLIATNIHDEHGYFAAHVRYKKHDPVVLVVLVEHVGSSLFAADIAKNFLIEYCAYLDSLDK